MFVRRGPVSAGRWPLANGKGAALDNGLGKDFHLLAPGVARRTAKKPPAERGASSEKSRRRPTLPGGYPPSTIGAGGLNCRVRNGNGCLSAAMATGNRALSGSNCESDGIHSEPGRDRDRSPLSVP